MGGTEQAAHAASGAADAAAAHELLCELRTRITTQPLPYQYGVESRSRAYGRFSRRPARR